MAKAAACAFVIFLYAVSWPAAAQTRPAPEQILYQNWHAFFSALNKSDRSTKTIERLLDTHVLPRADIEYMSRFIAGPVWRSSKNSLRKAFTKAFYQLLRRTYANPIARLPHLNLQILPMRRNLSHDRVIVSALVNLSGQRIPVHFYMRFTHDRWKAYDVKVLSFSLLNAYRIRLSGVIRRAGLEGALNLLSPTAAASP